MAMNTTILAASALSTVSILLLLALTGVWIRNYRTFGSSLTLGLVAFGSAMLFENAVAIYFFLSTTMLYTGDPLVQRAVLTMRVLQLVAVAFLTYVTIQ